MKRHAAIGGLCGLFATTACYSGVATDAGAETDGPDANDDTSGDDASGDPGSDDGDTDGDEPTESVCEDAPFSISAAPLHGLTRAQFRYSVEDLLGPSAELDEALERLGDLVDTKAGQFTTNTENTSKGIARTYMLIAENISTVVEASPGILPECPLGDATCVEPFLSSFGARVFRRPVRAEELDRYMSVWSTQNQAHDGPTAVRAALAAMFASPNFLYIEEPVLEGEGDYLDLEDYGLASRLSYYLWQSGPDEELLAVAGAGKLQDDGVLATQVDRMMEDPRFDRALKDFHQQLVGLDRLATFETADERWNDDLRADMMEEVGAFARFVFSESTGSIDELLTADYTIGTANLATLYGASLQEDGVLPLDSSERSGLLTLAGFLTMTSGESQEVHRGLFIRRSVMCEHPPELSEEDREEIELDPTVDRLNTQPCRGCHVYTDLTGFGFAKYGTLGEYLDDPSIDDSGEIVSLSPGGLEGPFNGAPELAQLLAGDDSVERCFATQWSRFATRRLETEDDLCVLEALGEQTVQTEGDLRTLIRSIALSPRFRVRRADSFTE